MHCIIKKFVVFYLFLKIWFTQMGTASNFKTQRFTSKFLPELNYNISDAAEF